MYVWDAKGQFLPGWPTVTDAEISASPVVADLNGDGRLEIIIGSKDQKVYIWDVEGRLLPGWPKATGGSIAASPAVADLDGDGTLEVVVGSKDQQVYVWSFPRTGSVTPRIAWQNFHGDPAHSGTYGFRPPTIIATVAMPIRPTDTPVPVTSAPDVRIIAAYPGATPQISGGSQAPSSEILPVTQTPIIPREILAGYISDLVISDYQGIRSLLPGPRRPVRILRTLCIRSAMQLNPSPKRPGPQPCHIRHKFLCRPLAHVKSSN